MTSLKASTSTSFDSFENISVQSSYDYDHLEDDYYDNYEGDVWSECIDEVEPQFSQAEIEAYESAIYDAEVADVQCNLISYEVTMFFESVSTNDTDYTEDFLDAGYSLQSEFMPHPPFVFNVGDHDYPAY